jgi:hypothetical protein
MFPLQQLFTPGGGLGSRSPFLGSTAMPNGFGQPNQLAGLLQGGAQGGGQAPSLAQLLAHLFGGQGQSGGLGTPSGLPAMGQPGPSMGAPQNPLMGLLSPQMLAQFPQLAALFRGSGGGAQQQWGKGFNDGSPFAPPMGGGMYGGGQPFMSR